MFLEVFACWLFGVWFVCLGLLFETFLCKQQIQVVASASCTTTSLGPILQANHLRIFEDLCLFPDDFHINKMSFRFLILVFSRKKTTTTKNKSFFGGPAVFKEKRPQNQKNSTCTLPAPPVRSSVFSFFRLAPGGGRGAGGRRVLGVDAGEFPGFCLGDDGQGQERRCFWWICLLFFWGELFWGLRRFVL